MAHKKEDPFPVLLDTPHPVESKVLQQWVGEAGIALADPTPLGELLNKTSLRADFLQTLSQIKTILWEDDANPDKEEEIRRLEMESWPDRGIPFYGYDGFAYARWISAHLGPALILTGRYLLTYEEADRRRHGRTFVVFGDTAVVSTWGALEAPAKEKVFYLKYQALVAAGCDPALAYGEALEESGGLAPEEERFQQVIGFLSCQALLFLRLLPDPCDSPDCFFFIARRQRELLRQAESLPRPCPRHDYPRPIRA